MSYRCRRCPLLTLVLLAVALAVPSAAQPASPPGRLGADTLFQMESLTNPEISPDGSTIVFSRGFVDLAKDQSQSNLWVHRIGFVHPYVQLRGQRQSHGEVHRERCWHNPTQALGMVHCLTVGSVILLCHGKLMATAPI